MAKTGVLLFAHGSRDQNWGEPLKLIRNAIAEVDKQVLVKLGFLEFMEPNLDTAISDLVNQGVERITLIPLFVSSGTHLVRDLMPLLDRVKQKHPAVKLTLSPSLGESEDMRDMIVDWAYRTHRNACRA